MEENKDKTPEDDKAPVTKKPRAKKEAPKETPQQRIERNLVNYEDALNMALMVFMYDKVSDDNKAKANEIVGLVLDKIMQL